MKKLTATQLDLLRAVAEGRVTHHMAVMGYAAEDRIHDGRRRTVTSRCWHMQRAGLITRDSAKRFAKSYWRLTDAGQAALDASGGAA